MKKKKEKKEEFYFKNLCACGEISLEAATFLLETMESFDKKELKKRMETLHELEHKADDKKHKMMTAVNQAFITPIEREDLIALSNYLDDITDAVEEVLIQIYMCNVDRIRPDAIPMVKALVKCIDALQDVLKELKRFKHTEKLEAAIIKVNDLEEKGDDLYVKNMHKLHKEDDVLTILAWRSIYECLETCMDTCEHAADTVNMVIMKNS